MMKKILIAVSSALMITKLSFAAIDLSGGIRNDSYFIKTTNDVNFEDILENKLVLTRITDEWRFYADMRLYVLYGNIPPSALPNSQATNLGISSSAPLNYDFDLLRAFVRYESPIGVWTAGKIYVNFGNYGIFNPFELNKTVDLSDLTYDKDGILALQYDYALSDLSGIKVYAGPQGGLTNSSAGCSFHGHVDSFDGGLVYNRIGIDTNKAGFYLKGDLEVGVNFSYAYHFDDHLTNNFSEAAAGIDYDFFDGKLQAAVTYYYDEEGAISTNNYQPWGFNDVYFSARDYLFGDFKYTYDEFLSFELYIFLNLVDFSGVIAPSLTYTLSDGLTLTLLFSYITGTGQDEFSQDTFGQYSLTVRFEAKL